ncbi:uridine kinase [Pseudarcicella hirudinis]|uniref:uridine/cytidine kinase n=1 Tax=Pseudarcicella hirudinis TaxID=1079859 RepID=A0A1I5UB00_9BACT|nr:uridine kinase [Pseudarcicella hirudinis]SFP92453.1 uridine kinase [Pseudarcicella hirudinis]
MTNDQRPFIVGITGGSASGKTLFLKQLLAALPEEAICLLSQDNYYRPLDQQIKDENGVENFDLPESMDDEALANDIKKLLNWEIVEKKEYTFNNKNIVPKMLRFEPKPIIVVEGIFVFHYPEVAKLIDLKVFIDAKNKIKLNRRIKRDNEERGYDLMDVMYRWKNHVQPTYKKYIRPYKKMCDIVIPNNENFQKGLNVLVYYLRSHIH